MSETRSSTEEEKQGQRDKGIKVHRTDELGDIEVVNDGKNWWIKN